MKRLIIYFLVIALIIVNVNKMAVYANANMTEEIPTQNELFKKWMERGVIKGDKKGQTRANKKITKAEFLTIINSVLGYIDTDANQFDDVESTTWYANEFLKARSAGYIDSFGYNNIDPTGLAKKQWVFNILVNAFRLKTNKIHKNYVYKKSSISDWEDNVNSILSTGNLKKDHKIFSDNEYITRYEILSVLDRLVSIYINKPGTYIIPEDNKGIIIVSSDGVVIKNSCIKNRIYIVQEASGEIILDNTTVESELIIKSGREKTVRLRNCHISSVNTSQVDGLINIISEGNTKIDKSFEEKIEILNKDINSLSDEDKENLDRKATKNSNKYTTKLYENNYFSFYCDRPLINGKVAIDSYFMLEFKEGYSFDEAYLYKSFIMERNRELYELLLPLAYIATNSENNLINKMFFESRDALIGRRYYMYNKQHKFIWNEACIIKDGVAVGIDNQQSFNINFETYTGKDNIIKAGIPKDHILYKECVGYPLGLQTMYHIKSKPLKYSESVRDKDICELDNMMVITLTGKKIGETTYTIRAEEENEYQELVFNIKVIDSPITIECVKVEGIDCIRIKIKAGYSLDEKSISKHMTFLKENGLGGFWDHDFIVKKVSDKEYLLYVVISGEIVSYEKDKAYVLDICSDIIKSENSNNKTTLQGSFVFDMYPNEN